VLRAQLVRGHRWRQRNIYFLHHFYDNEVLLEADIDMA